MEKIDYEKEFLSIYNKFNQKYSKWEVWKDFLYLSAASMANTVKTAEWQQREERYLQTIGKYEKEYQEMMPNLFAVTAQHWTIIRNRISWENCITELVWSRSRKGSFLHRIISANLCRK